MIPTVRRFGITSALFMLSAVCESEAQQPSLPPDLIPALFPASSAWKMSTYQGPKSDLVVAQVDGQPVFRVGTSGLTLASRDKITGDVELRLRFRMTSPDDKGCSLTLTPGLADEKKTVGPLRLSLSI